MADERLIFPLGFDLEKGVKDVLPDIPRKLDPIQKKLDKNPLNISLKLNTQDLNNLDAVKARLAKLKLEPITPETKSAITDLTNRLKDLAKILEQIEKINKRVTSGMSAGDARALRAADAHRLAEEKLAKAKLQTEAAELRLARAQEKVAGTTERQNKSYKTQHGYLGRLIQRMTVYASVGAVSGFLSKVREVTAQFELQRVSLGAIIQSQSKADEIFGQIKSFALKSPISILDLTTYVKQVAAYRIETDKLFETTKRLADVSVGLGVDMQRIVLAYGQVKAASYLRASEVRQFTEAGIPMLELLAEKFTALKGTVVSTSDVMEMISQRMVSFDMVADIFQDMTDKGGIFYNMQEKQGNTLYGMWGKLKDAASIMYNEIGNTDSVNKGMKDLIGSLTEMMRNWKSVAREIAIVAATFVLFKQASKILGVFSANNIAAAKATRDLARAERTKAQAVKDGNGAMVFYASYQKKIAALNLIAAKSTNVFKVASAKLRATLMSFGPQIIIAGIMLLIEKLYSAYEAAHKLENEIKDIEREGGAESQKMVSNFTSLVNQINSAPDGSKKQRDALEELQRTYKDIIPIQDLTLESLKKMKDEGYEPLTKAVKEYVAAETQRKMLDAVSSEYGRNITDAEKKIKNYDYNIMTTQGIQKLSDAQKERLIEGLKKYAEDAKLTIKEVYQKAMEDYVGFELPKNFETAFYTEKLINLYRDQKQAIDDATNSMKKNYSELGLYSTQLQDIDEKTQNMTFSFDKNSLLGQQEQANYQIKLWIEAIQQDLKAAGVQISEDWYTMVDAVSASQPLLISSMNLQPVIDALGEKKPLLKNLLIEIQRQYAELVPTDPVTIAIRNKFFEIASSVQGGLVKMSKYLYDGKTSIADHVKTMKESATQLEQTIFKYAQYIKTFGALGKLSLTAMGIDVDAMTEELNALRKLIEEESKYLKPEEDKKSKSGSSKQDNRLQNLQEEISLLEKMYGKYQEFSKYLSKDESQKKVNQQFKKTLETFKKYGIALPTTAEEYKKALEIMKTRMAKLPKSAKAVMELGFKIDDVDWEEYKRKLEGTLKDLGDRISRSKTMQEFFDKILEQTGSESIAKRFTVAVYGENGSDLQDDIKSQLHTAFADAWSAEIAEAIGQKGERIDFSAVRKYYEENIESIPEKMRDTIKKILEEQEKLTASNMQQWLKDLKGAQSYAEKRIELARKTQSEITKIQNTQGLKDDDKNSLIAGYKKREAQEAAKLEYEAFKNTPMYVALFDDLDNASSVMLRNMRDSITRLKDQWKDLDPTQLKELQKNLNAIDKVLIQRNPFKALSNSIRDMKNWKTQYGSIAIQEDKMKTANEELVSAQERLNKAIEAQRIATLLLNGARGTGDSKKIKSAEKIVGQADKEVKDAKENVEQTQNQANELQQILDLWRKIRDGEKDAGGEINAFIDKIGKAVDDMADAVESWTALGDNAIWKTIREGLGGLESAAKSAVTAFFSTNPIEQVTAGISAISGLVSTIGNIFYGAKVAKAEAEIKKQQKLIEKLEYSYEKLEKAMEKAFGSDYISNYNQQLNNLRAQQIAYQKQLQAEQSKGKKADEDKIQDYEDKIQEIKDEIADLSSAISEKLTGTDVTSAATEFAQAWLEAYQSFANTTDAMTDKFREMIQNMVVNSVLAKVMERELQPIFDFIDSATEGFEYDADFWKDLTAMTDEAASNMVTGSETMAKLLQAYGIDLRDTSSDLTGISRDIATASEDSINGLAQGITTQNYYMKTVAANTAMIVQLMQSGGTQVSQGVSTTDLLTLQNQHLSYLPNIAQNTAEMVQRCERAAIACEDMATLMRGAIKPKGTTPTKVVYTQIC